MELYLTPKPGLVDLADSGSHRDLSLGTMERSLAYVADYLDEMVSSLTRGDPFLIQRKIAIQVEQRLLDVLGTNTHKGFIFLSGMLLIARWQAASSNEHAIRSTLSSLAVDFFASGEGKTTNGQQARRRYHAGGIVLEAINGLPSLFEQALPAFRTAIHRHGCFAAASFAMLARLMQTVEDTTTLHRAGPLGLSRVRRDGRQLERVVASGDDPVFYLSELNRSYRRMNITMGGIADMLGLSYGYLIAGGEITQESEEPFNPIRESSPPHPPRYLNSQSKALSVENELMVVTSNATALKSSCP